MATTIRSADPSHTAVSAPAPRAAARVAASRKGTARQHPMTIPILVISRCFLTYSRALFHRLFFCALLVDSIVVVSSPSLVGESSHVITGICSTCSEIFVKDLSGSHLSCKSFLVATGGSVRGVPVALSSPVLRTAGRSPPGPPPAGAAASSSPQRLGGNA